jgi:hypothetical protein
LGELPPEDPPREPPRPKAARGFCFGVLVSATKPKASRGFFYGAFTVRFPGYAPKPANGLGFISPAKRFAGFASRVD